MKFFKSLKLKNSGQVCEKCAYFQGDPAHIEEAYPGLSIMSSGYASVRAQDGLCSYNQLYLSARDSCPHFTPRTTELADIVI
ncbi:hypothetical protein HDF24_19350 [Mucilaginibacter sp. X4EP1]|uniref:hypothetical protein n=1 Tax=Mucilaginibacter sp. X4EP1 TaxID=2723092 RepID=UPI002168FF25|nr:hypothetical protein [Mucilaginibacter sp. X4EP1]MCS3813264.1 hypothetical protein [Mucilaginibacter sp. X4EP1]